VTGDDPTSSVSYTAEILNDAGDAPDFTVAVLTYILGPLRDANGGFGTQSMFRQEFTITNVSGTAQTLESVSYLLPDFYETDPGDTYDETATADAATGVAYATDGNTTRFLAMAANQDGYDMAWDVGAYGGLPDPTTFADLAKTTGPVSDPHGGVEMATGLRVPWTLAPAASVTLRFSYFVSMNQRVPPTSFPAGVPAPATAALLLPGLALVGALRRRGRRAAGR
jgi:hypothetical protein